VPSDDPRTHSTASSVTPTGATGETVSPGASTLASASLGADVEPRRVPGIPRLDAAVLEAVKRGDRDALGRFFDHYFDHVYRLVLRLVGNSTVAEDVTQEVFFKVQRASHQLDTSRDPAPWLTAIATNACRDVWRSGAHRMARRTETLDGQDGLAERLSSGGNEPERLVLSREREGLVRDAIDRLPDPLREAVLLYDYQGLSHQEIADVLGIQHAAARKRYSRALEALGKILRETIGT